MVIHSAVSTTDVNYCNKKFWLQLRLQSMQTPIANCTIKSRYC